MSDLFQTEYEFLHDQRTSRKMSISNSVDKRTTEKYERAEKNLLKRTSKSPLKNSQDENPTCFIRGKNNFL